MKLPGLEQIRKVFQEDAGKVSKPGIKTPRVKLFSKKQKISILEYDPAKHGPLVSPEISDDYRHVDHYWVDLGESLVIIAENKRTNQNEYLLFEPVLSDFQYELIERVHADLRNILILDDEELVQDKRQLLIEKMDYLFDEYGIHPDQNTLFKLQYYLIRNFLGWGRIEALMKDPYIEDISCDGIRIPL